MKKIFLFTFFFIISLICTLSYVIVVGKKISFSFPKIPIIPNFSVTDFMKLSRFSIAQAPSDSLTGSIADFSGDVFWEKRLATRSAQLYSPSQIIQQGESLETKDGVVRFQVPSAPQSPLVIVTVNENSQINIIQTLKNNLVFAHKFGTIEYTKLGDTPVGVRVGHLLVDVRGGVVISLSDKSPAITLQIKKGSAVVAFNDLKNITNVVNLNESQNLEFNEDNRQVVLK